jgi:hypothetical protein
VRSRIAGKLKETRSVWAQRQFYSCAQCGMSLPGKVVIHIQFNFIPCADFLYAVQTKGNGSITSVTV